MRIAFLLHGAGAAQKPVVARTVDLLARRGVVVDTMLLDDRTVDLSPPRVSHDLYVLKSKTDLSYSVAGALEIAGASVVNTFEASFIARDKIGVTAALAAAGLPVPGSWLSGGAERFAPLLADGPLWVKAQHGKAGVGVYRARRVGALKDVGADELGFPLPAFAQREVAPGSKDFKVYVVGDRMWALVKPWPARTPSDKIGHRAPVPPSVAALTLAAGRRLGLELYGIDFLLEGDRCWIVDVNPFPGYNGLAEAPAAIAEYLVARASRPAAERRRPAAVGART